MLAVEWSTGIEEAFTDVATFVPKLVGAGVVLLVGWIVARIVRRILLRVLGQVGLERAIARSGLPDTLGRPINGARTIAAVVFWIIMLSTLQVAMSVFGENPITTSIASLVAFLPRLLVAAAIVVIAGLVAEKVGRVVSSATQGRPEQRTLTTATRVAVYVVGGFMALDQLGVAEDIVDTLFQTLVLTVAGIAVVKFGVGGIWAARDRFWPGVYDRFAGDTVDVTDRSAPDGAREATRS